MRLLYEAKEEAKANFENERKRLDDLVLARHVAPQPTREEQQLAPQPT